MMPQESFVRPPRIAEWFLTLFTPFAQSDAIAGDMQEEFSDVASKSGVAFARRWYRRQTVRTIANLFVAGFSAAPWAISSAIIGGLLLAWLIPTWTSRALFVITREHGVYVQKRLLFMGSWVHTDLLLIGMLEMFLIGCIVAIAARGKEIVATMTLLLAQAVLSFGVALWMIERGILTTTSPTHSSYLLALVISLAFLERTFTAVLGGLMVRMYRNSAMRRTSAV